MTCFRPFPSVEIVEALKGVKAFSVAERMDNPMVQSNPLTREIKAAFADAVTGHAGYPEITRIPQIYAGAAGLGSRDLRPGHFIAMTRNMMNGDGLSYFVVGIDHELALTVDEEPDLRPDGGFSMRGHSVGGFGSVTTNKIIATIVGEVFGKEVQAYPKYGSEKKGLQPGGTVFIQTKKTTPEEVWANVPPKAKAQIREKNIRVLALDAAKIALEEAPKADLEVRMQGIVLLGIFLKATPFDEEAGLSYDEVMTGVKKAVRKYGNRGEVVVQANLRAIGRGYNEVFELPEACLASDITNPSLDPKADLVLFELDIL